MPRQLIVIPAAVAILLATGANPSRASLSPGQPSPADPLAFTFYFDEDGNGTLYMPHPVTNTGFLRTDPTWSGHTSLTFTLPGLVQAGAYDITEYGSLGVISDEILFTDASGDTTGLVADRMIFYSFDGGTQLADQIGGGSPPTSNIATNYTTEDALGNFGFGTTDKYTGISPEPTVPEPASLIAWTGLGAMGLIACIWRRRKVKS